MLLSAVNQYANRPPTTMIGSPPTPLHPFPSFTLPRLRAYWRRARRMTRDRLWPDRRQCGNGLKDE